MSIYYVQPNGDNGNTGTGPAPGDAWAEVAYGVTQLTDGDTLLVAPGSYADASQITKDTTADLTIFADIDSIYFSGYVSPGPVNVQWTVGASNEYAMWFRRCHNLDVQNFTILGSTSGMYIIFGNTLNTASIAGITCKVSGNYGFNLGNNAFAGNLTIVNCSSTGPVTYTAMQVHVKEILTITGGTLSNFGLRGIYNIYSSTRTIKQVTIRGGDTGIMLRDEDTDCIIENCLITDFKDHGVNLQGTITARYNTIVAGPVSPGDLGIPFYEAIGYPNAFTVRDNILIADNDSGGAINISDFSQLIDSDYNDLYNRDPSGPVCREGSNQYATLADWQAASGDDANSISQEPLFMRESSRDYHLLTGSPCLDSAGDNPPIGPDIDLENDIRPQNGISDMGCYEGAEARGALYVRTDGDDTNPGTGPLEDEALATLWKALDICYDSDIIYVAPGTYSETSEDYLYVDNTNLTIIGDVTGSKFPDISAGQIITDRGSKTAYLNFRTANTVSDPTTVSGIWPKSSTPTGFTAFVFENGSSYVILQGINVTDLAIATSMIRYFVRTESGSSNITVRRCHIIRMNGGVKEGALIELDGGATVRIENALLVQPSGTTTGAIYVTSGFSGGAEIYNCDLFVPTGVAGRCLYVAGPNVTLKNNILIANMNNPTQSVVLEVTAGATGTFTSDYNDLLQRGLGSFGLWGGNLSSNLAGWQSDSSQDATSLSSEPLFSSESQPEDEGLSIGSDSPCRDTGTSDGGNAPTEDILQFGRPSGSDYDIGAYEYPSSIAVIISKTSRR